MRAAFTSRCDIKGGNDLLEIDLDIDKRYGGKLCIITETVDTINLMLCIQMPIYLCQI